MSRDVEPVLEPGSSTPEDGMVEIVERKGLGHPDTMCDAVAEQVALALARAYRERTGAIQHFNADKILLIAGRAEPAFGGGRVLEPIRLIIGDRATPLADLPLAELAETAALDWVRKNLRHLDPAQVRVECELKQGSAQLRGVAAAAMPAANDTSVGVGFAPLTETERLVLRAERMLNDPVPGLRRRWLGEDVKVLGVRRGRRLELTVAAPLVDRYVGSEAEYFDRKRTLAAEMREALAPQAPHLELAPLELNALDRPGNAEAGVYLTVTGTSAESADSGEVGRGNRANGLITFNRPMTLEATAGKNPAYHVGKIYSVLAQQIAEHLCDRVSGLRGATVWLWSRIGLPVSEPAGIAVQLVAAPGAAFADLRLPASAAVREDLERLPELSRELADGKWSVY